MHIIRYELPYKLRGGSSKYLIIDESDSPRLVMKQGMSVDGKSWWDLRADTRTTSEILEAGAGWVEDKLGKGKMEEDSKFTEEEQVVYDLFKATGLNIYTITYEKGSEPLEFEGCYYDYETGYDSEPYSHYFVFGNDDSKIVLQERIMAMVVSTSAKPRNGYLSAEDAHSIIKDKKPCKDEDLPALTNLKKVINWCNDNEYKLVEVRRWGNGYDSYKQGFIK